jgi:O-antigen ligase
MASALRQAVAPAYLLLCLVLGGSAQGVWSNLILQLAGVAIIAWAAVAPADEPLARPVRQVLWLIAAGLAVVALQLVPLPASLWPQLGARAEIARGYEVLGLPVPAAPLSLAPYDSVATLLTLIPALAMFCAIVRLKAYRPSWLALALLAGAFAGIFLGILQVSSADPASSPWYLYRSTNRGHAVGFFANANHMAILLVSTLPFLAALLSSARGSNVQRYSAAVALVAAAGLVVLVGIALNRSIAGYGLAIPALAASALIVLPARRRARLWIGSGAALVLAAVIAAIALSPGTEQKLGASVSVSGRAAIAATSLDATRDFLPFGSGLGTFREVYRLYEDHDRATSTYVNHVHNDYVELALEMGLPAIMLMALFLAWFLSATGRVWRFADAGPYARAASIAAAAVLVHSLVDFPLRTAAISSMFAMCLALLVMRPPRRGAERSELWPTRHVVLE